MEMTQTKVVNRNGKWVVQQKDDLGKYKQVGSFDDKLDALAHRKLVKEAPAKAAAAVQKLSVVNAWRRYAEYKWNQYNKYNSLGESQAKLYKRNFENWIEPWFKKDLKLRELGSKDLRDFFLILRREGCTWKTARTIVYQFKGMCEYCINEKLILRSDYHCEFFEINDYAELKANDGSDKARQTTMITMREAEELYEEIKPRDKTNYTYTELVNFIGICLFMYLGARPGEIRAIKWSNVSFITKRIKIDGQITMDGRYVSGTKTDNLGVEKSEVGRVLIIPTKLLKLLIKFQAKQKEFLDNPTWVLQHQTTRMPIPDKQLRNFLWRSYANIGLAEIEDIGNHVKVISSKFKHEPFKTFRHFASTALLDNQAATPVLSDNVIRTQVGHQDIKTTRTIYAKHSDLHSSTPRDQEIIEALDKALDFDKITTS